YSRIGRPRAGRHRDVLPGALGGPDQCLPWSVPPARTGRDRRLRLPRRAHRTRGHAREPRGAVRGVAGAAEKGARAPTQRPRLTPVEPTMNVQIFGFKNCQDTRRAQRFFAERRIAVHFVDLDERPAAKGELRRFAERFGPAALIDKEGARYKALGLRVAGDSPQRL